MPSGTNTLPRYGSENGNSGVATDQLQAGSSGSTKTCVQDIVLVIESLQEERDDFVRTTIGG